MSGSKLLYYSDHKTYHASLKLFKDSSDEIQIIGRWIRSSLPRKYIRLLDIGTGNGSLIKLLANRITSVIAIEPDRKFAVSLRRHGIPTIEKTWQKSGAVGSYDVIIASHVFYYFSRHTWEKQVDAMARLLTPRGRLFIVINGSDGNIMECLAERQEEINKYNHYDTDFLRTILKHKKYKFSISQLRCHAKVISWQQFCNICRFHLELSDRELKSLERKLRASYDSIKKKSDSMLNYTLDGLIIYAPSR